MIEPFEIIREIERPEHFYRKPANPKIKHLNARIIETPELLEVYKNYTYHREQMYHYAIQLRQLFQPIQDQPMRVEKNHVIRENEIHQFNDDGTINIKPKSQLKKPLSQE